MPPPPPPEAAITTSFGGVLIDAALILLPVNDATVFAALPALDHVRAIIVCNGRDHGVLRTSAIAKAAGLTRVFAIDHSRPVDTGAPTTVAVKPLPRRLRLGVIDLFAREGNVVAQVPGQPRPLALVGDAVPMSLVYRVMPETVIGMIGMDEVGHIHDSTALRQIDGAVLMANVPGIDVTETARFLASIGVPTTVVNGANERSLATA